MSIIISILFLKDRNIVLRIFSSLFFYETYKYTEAIEPIIYLFILMREIIHIRAPIAVGCLYNPEYSYEKTRDQHMVYLP